MKSYIIFGLVISLIASVFTFIIFIENYNAIERWKFYASLVGFLIFLLMFIVNIFSLLYLKKRISCNFNNEGCEMFSGKFL